MVQWLRITFQWYLCSNTGKIGSVPGWGTKIPHATDPACCNQDSKQPNKLIIKKNRDTDIEKQHMNTKRGRGR